MKIDLHAHVVLPQTLEQAGRLGPSVSVNDGIMTVRVGDYALRSRKAMDGAREGYSRDESPVLGSDPRRRIELMDRVGWDVHVLSISPLFYLYWAEPDVAVPFATLQNEALAEYCTAFPDRLAFYATLPMQDVEASVAELKRAADMGAKGVMLGCRNLGGREIDDPAFDPVWEQIQHRGLLVFLHGAPSAVDDQGPDRYQLTAFLGYIHDETVAFARLIFGGVLDRFPGLHFYISHGGGFVPYQFHRIEGQSIAVTDTVHSQPFRTYLKNFSFDLLVGGESAQRMVLNTFSDDNIVSGDNFDGLDGVDALAIAQGLDLPSATLAKILGGNAARVLSLEA